MATTTRTLTASKYGWVDDYMPDTIFAVGSSWMKIGDGKFFYFGTATFPSSLKRRKLYGIELSVPFKNDFYYENSVRVSSCDKDFSASSITYNNSPNVVSHIGAGEIAAETTGNVTISATTGAGNLARDFLQHCVGRIERSTRIGLDIDTFTKKTLVGGGSIAVKVYYDDAAIVESKPYFAFSFARPVDPRAMIPFSWSLVKTNDSEYCVDENFVQASAKFQWRVSGASSWNTIDISGTEGTTSDWYTPANTFPTGATIQCRVQTTDTAGSTGTSQINSFTTISPQITPYSYPLGTSVDNRASQKFTWTFETDSPAGPYGQQSAEVRWHVYGASTWNSLPASGTTKSVTAPGYTFPAGKQIVWYLRGTDSGGHTSTTETAQKSFTTQGYTLTMTSFPQGSGVTTKAAVSFAWTIKNSSGDATQQSAKLYWKTSTASTWNTIPNNTSTKSISVAAYTFPNASTIQWYLEVTAADGTVLTRNSAQSPGSFTTASPAIHTTSAPTGSNVDTRIQQTFSWEFQSAAGNYPQTSATLYWRVGSSGNFTPKPASGSTTSVTFDAYTFPTASTIQWYVEGTAKGGTTTRTSTASFSTATPNIKATNAPSGSDVDTRSAITFSWEFQSAVGNYPQTSATLYWRVGTTGAYTTKAASGATTSVSFAANFFPTASTIQWYIVGTDRSGRTTQTTVASFTTVTPKVVAKTYPSGTNVYTGRALSWTWEIESAVGNYAQTSARLGWRTDTANPYTYISASGGTKNMSVPANTFPTNATIYWILEATDVGGHTSTTTATSFKTATSQITVQNSPTSGYTDPRNPVKFQWYFSTTGGAVTQGSATLHWKVSTASTYNSVSASGTTTSVTIAANVIPVASTIDWYVDGTDYSGTPSTSPVYSFSTAAGTAYAYPQAPIGTAEDGSKPIVIRWTLVNADGSSPIRVTLSWKKTTDISWTVLRQATSAITSYTAPAGTFPTGEIEWKVVATNRDSIDGPAGTAAFVCLRAPDAPSGLRATNAPITTISWQAAGQEAYEIYIDGEVVRKAFGAGVSSWTVPEPLTDGVHVVTVRVQGAYGLWSEPSATTADIQNEVPEGWEDFSLSGSFDVDAMLTAAGASDASDRPVQWYRDGRRIAQTDGRRHTDRFVLGKHSYYAEIWSDDGNYVRSETIVGSMKSCVTRIAPFEGGEWLELRLSEHSDSEQNFSYARTNTLRHVLGAKLPVLELADFEDGSGSYDCAFKDVESAAELEALFGRIVILKSRGGNVVIGGLTELSKKNTDFYISYGFTVQRIAWEDFVYG